MDYGNSGFFFIIFKLKFIDCRFVSIYFIVFICIVFFIVLRFIKYSLVGYIYIKKYCLIIINYGRCN